MAGSQADGNSQNRFVREQLKGRDMLVIGCPLSWLEGQETIVTLYLQYVQLSGQPMQTLGLSLATLRG